MLVSKPLQAFWPPANPKGRELAAGIEKSLILEWVNHADLYRIKGVGQSIRTCLKKLVWILLWVATRSPRTSTRKSWRPTAETVRRPLEPEDGKLGGTGQGLPAKCY